MKVTGCKKIYNAENIMEAEMLVERKWNCCIHTGTKFKCSGIWSCRIWSIRR